jgi:acetyl-CoA carboxylase biotin carboxylase subunit
VFNKILIANRGEIALRVICACRELGIKTVAVYSEADEHSLHVRFADEDVCIGPARSLDSYLSVPAIISAAEITGADAIHPGYGFLSESAYLAEVCEACHIKFIGPYPNVIRLMGDKARARRAMKKAGVPVLPGSDGPVQGEEQALKIAKELGYPVIIKAVAGGGGRGMRVVQANDELGPAIKTATREAEAAFGVGDVYLEKYLESPRHIEIQVLGDHHLNVVHLGERECSIQRRHQKLIEESPSPFVTPEMRQRMGEAACAVAAAVGYVNAGTVEFLVDRERRFYFLEMNTRLQVEHPVTELVTGRDLVKEQLRIAAGDKLGFTQADVVATGWAIECRINAEDPHAGFIPSPGRITSLSPASGPWVRDDSGVYAGYTVPRFYDTLLAKLIVWAPDRDAAIARMERALGEYHVAGVRTTIPLLQRVMRDPEFQAGRLSTHYLDRLMHEAGFAGAGRRRRVAIIAAALAANDQAGRRAPAPDGAGLSAWTRSGRPGGR